MSGIGETIRFVNRHKLFVGVASGATLLTVWSNGGIYLGGGHETNSAAAADFTCQESPSVIEVADRPNELTAKTKLGKASLGWFDFQGHKVRFSHDLNHEPMRSIAEKGLSITTEQGSFKISPTTTKVGSEAVRIVCPTPEPQKS